MTINWVTVIAQIFNFVILIALLYFLLYKRIVRAMDERQRRIQSQLEQAEQTKQQADDEAQAYRQKRQELDAQREQWLAQAKQEVETVRREQEGHVREQIAAQSRQWARSLQEQRSHFLQQLRDQAGQKLCEIARQTLADLADAELEGQAVEAFRRRMEQLEDAQRKDFAEAIGEAKQNLTVYSAWPLPAEQQEQIAAAIREQFGQAKDIRFEQSPELICGIELRGGGRAIGWSVHHYLEELSERVDELLQERLEDEQAEPKAEEAAEGPARQDRHEQSTEKQDPGSQSG